MIPVSIVRYAPNQPCTLQASAESWERLYPLLRSATGPKDTERAVVVTAIREARGGDRFAQRVTLTPAMARWVLDMAGVS